MITKTEIKNAVYNILRKDGDEYIEGIPVFFGGMLSGVHAMDKSSIIRLKNEIKNVVKF